MIVSYFIAHLSEIKLNVNNNSDTSLFLRSDCTRLGRWRQGSDRKPYREFHR